MRHGDEYDEIARLILSMGYAASRRWKSQKKFFYRIGKDAMSRRIGSAEAAVKRLTVEYTSTLPFTPLLLICLTHKTRELFFRFCFLSHLIPVHCQYHCLQNSQRIISSITWNSFPLSLSQNSKRKHRKGLLRSLTATRITFCGTPPSCMNIFNALSPICHRFFFFFFLIKLRAYSFTMKHYHSKHFQRAIRLTLRRRCFQSDADFPPQLYHICLLIL